MSEPSLAAFPWINIPPSAQPGQPHAFANRERQLAQLYNGIVEAGNAVRAGQTSVRYRTVVSGYMGVGKSALILQALGMLRDEIGIANGQRVALTPTPEPRERERWVILRASGKRVAGFDAIADDMRRSIISVFNDVRQEAERTVPGALSLSIFHRLLRTREAKVFDLVHSALRSFVRTIEYVRTWEGSVQTDKLETSMRVDTSGNFDAYIEAQLKRAIEPRSEEDKAALKVALGYIRKVVSSVTTGSTIERQIVIGAELLVDALNAFFEATDRAGIPTILVLDDFDEFASNVGPSHANRAKVLASALGPFTSLAPTCLIIGLREEYSHEDIRRQYTMLHVPPMTRSCSAQALLAWSSVQQPPLPDELAQRLIAYGDRFLRRFGEHDRVVIPFHIFRLAVWCAKNDVSEEESNKDLLFRYLQLEFPTEVCRAVERVADMMPDEDVRRCVEAVSVDPEPYAFSKRERFVLEKYGLLRPAMAGDPDDTSIVLDPLCAYFRASLAERRVEPVAPSKK